MFPQKYILKYFSNFVISYKYNTKWVFSKPSVHKLWNVYKYRTDTILVLWIKNYVAFLWYYFKTYFLTMNRKQKKRVRNKMRRTLSLCSHVWCRVISLLHLTLTIKSWRKLRKLVFSYSSDLICMASDSSRNGMFRYLFNSMFFITFLLFFLKTFKVNK